MVDRVVGWVWEGNVRRLLRHVARGPDAYPVMVRVCGDLDDVLTARVDTLMTVFGDSDGDR